ncbi:TIGR03086 family metal-binding protein [Streptomyces sp. NPDC087440]|uniref:TIGR03086 family metal-binding protein n=1 Tax=Streptomyces sp. NPDC087440 TaxID=3365790 RepID=UPI0038282334
MTSTQWDVLDEAHRAIRTAAIRVAAEQWTAPTPCTEWNVAQVLRHAAGDQLMYAEKITGGEGPGYDPFAPAATAFGDEQSAAALLDPALSRTAEAFAGVKPDDSAVPVPLPPFTLSAELAVGAAALDAVVHAWDIAVATGRPSPLTPELARTLLPVARELVEPVRGFAFAAAVEPAADADDVALLLNYLGRRADWTPGA